MEKPLIYVFDEMATAQRVRDELLKCGFDPAGVRLSSTDDEAGPVQGNFTVGNSPAAVGGADYKDTYAGATQRGTCLLTITPVDATQAQYAVKLLARYGVCDDPAEMARKRAQGGAAGKAP
jgi:hypothetical protein